MTFVSMKIAGAQCTSSSNRTFVRLNPITGEVASEAASATVTAARTAADSAAAAFPAWAALGPNARRAVLLKAADALAARTDQFITAMPEGYTLSVQDDGIATRELANQERAETPKGRPVRVLRAQQSSRAVPRPIVKKERRLRRTL